MEDISNTPNKKDEHHLKLFATEGARSFFNEKSFSFFEICSQSSDADFFIDYIHGNYVIKSAKGADLHFESKGEYLINRLSFLYKHQVGKFENRNNLFQKSSVKLEKLHQKTSDQFSQINQLNLNLYENFELVQFCQNLFSLKSLKYFQTLHLFVHEKGQATSSHFEISRDTHREYQHNINDFTTLFQSIKKSKNRSFGQASLKGIDFDILGTFLAHEFSLKNYNLILIISRNDFLHQTKAEQDFFTFLSMNLPSYIEILLESRLLSNKIDLTNKALEHAPYEINKIATIDAGHKYNLKPMFELVLNKADIFHHERVSLLGELLNTLRHELSNPLFGLQLTTELLLLDLDSKESEEILSEILKSIKRSQNIIENFTNLYQGTEEFSNVDVIKVINEVFTLTKSESRHLHKTVKTDLQSITINTNPTWLAQIFFNLIINSAQATKDFSNQHAFFEIKIQLDTDSLIFDIQDNGPGIPMNLYKEIFKPFFTTKKKGTGLGLAISKSLANKLNGHLDYIPNDKGARFLLKLPYGYSSH